MLQPTERADARANRGRLIAAAHEVLRERGADAEMKEIAERAGLGVGTIYRNFPTKDDLIAAILGEAIDEIQETMERAAAIEDPVEALRSFLRGGFQVSDRFGDLLMAMMHGRMPEGCHQQFERLDDMNRVTVIVQNGIDRGAFRPGLDPAIVAAQLIACFVPWHYQDLRRTRTPEQIADAYIDLILNGVLRTED